MKEREREVLLGELKTNLLLKSPEFSVPLLLLLLLLHQFLRFSALISAALFIKQEREREREATKRTI